MFPLDNIKIRRGTVGRRPAAAVDNEIRNLSLNKRYSNEYFTAGIKTLLPSKYLENLRTRDKTLHMTVFYSMLKGTA